MSENSTNLCLRIKHVVSFLLLYFLLENSLYAVQVNITPNQLVVDEGDVATVTVSFTQDDTDNFFVTARDGETRIRRGCSLRLALDFTGSATRNTDYSVSGLDALNFQAEVVDDGQVLTNDPQTRSVSYRINNNDGFDPNEVIRVAVSEAPSIDADLRICTIRNSSLSWPETTIRDTEVSKDLSGTLLPLFTEVQEGSRNTTVANIEFDYPTGRDTNNNCRAIAVVRATSNGGAREGVDFNFTPVEVDFDNGDDGVFKRRQITLDILEGIVGDGDKSVELQARFRLIGDDANTNRCRLITNSVQTHTILIKDSITKDLHGTLEAVGFIQEGAGFREVGNIVFTLPQNMVADANCNATARVSIIGGSARRGVDFDSFTSSTLRFGVGDGSPKSQSISLNILQGAAGDGDKTIELEATFSSIRGERGSSCPLGSASTLRRTITIRDTIATPLTGLLTLQNTVQEGSGFQEVGSIQLALSDNRGADDNCRASAQVRIIEGAGSAQLGADYDSFSSIPLFFGTGDGNSKSEPISLNILQGAAADGDMTIVVEATFISNGNGQTNSCPLNNGSPLVVRQTIRVIDTLSTDLNAEFNSTETTIQRASSIKQVQIGSINFSLPAARQVDRNCRATATIEISGGNAIRGDDFSFRESVITFGDDGRNTQTDPIFLNILPGKPGDRDKTVELRATFRSLGGRDGDNSCPLISGSPQTITVNILGRLERPKVEVRIRDVIISSMSPSGQLPVEIIQTPAGSQIDCNVRVALTPSNDIRGLATIRNTQFTGLGGNATINVDSRGKDDQSFTVGANLTVDETLCDIVINGINSTSKVTIVHEFVAPTITASSSALSASDNQIVNVTYKIEGDTDECGAIHPMVVRESTTATADQYTIDNTINLIDQPTVPVRIGAPNANQDSILVLGAVATNRCQLSMNNTAAIRISRKNITEVVNKVGVQRTQACNALRISVATSTMLDQNTRDVETIQKLTGSDRSYYQSNCVNLNDSRNYEPEELASQGQAALGAANRQLRNVRSRLDKLRSTGGHRGVDVSGANIRIQSENISAALFGGGSGDGVNDQLESRWGVFTNGEYGFGSQNRGNDRSGFSGDRNFDFNSKGLTVGADYRFPGEKFIAGAAVGYKDFEADFTSQEGGTKTEGYNISVYGTYLASDKAYIDGVIGVGRDKIETQRPVNNDGSGGIGNRTTFATGKPDATEITASIGGGYEFNQGGAWSQTPYARVDYVKSEVDTYTESASHSSANTSTFSINKRDVEQLTSTLGVKVNRAINTSQGVFVPHASIEWRHEFKDIGSITGQSVFLNDNPQHNVSPNFIWSNGNSLDKNYYNMDIGVSASFENGKSAYLNVESRLGDSVVDDNAIKAGYRWSFY